MLTKKLPFVFLFIFLYSSCAKDELRIEFPDNPSEKMQEFVINISEYAKKVKPDFLIIPQNGIELAFKNLDVSQNLYTPYTNAIDGIGIEALFYDGTELPTYSRLTMLQKISDSKKVLVSDYVSNNSWAAVSIDKNSNEGFLPFPRMDYNYDYMHIPDFIFSENDKDIQSIHDAENYLYLINANNFSSKEALLAAISETNFDLVLIDLFFHGFALTPEDLVQLKKKNNGAKRLVISYMNIGAAEKYRFYFDRDHWTVNNPHWLLKPYKGYPDEIFVKFWSSEWHHIIYGHDDSYIKKSIDSGFDGAYLDNVKAYNYLFSDEF